MRETTLARRPFAIARLGLLEPFVAALEAGGIDAPGLLAEMGLPTLGQGERFVPQQAVYRFVAEAARRLDDPHLGARLGANRDNASWPPWRHAIALATTVGDLLTWFIVGVEHHGTAVRYSLAVGDRSAIFQQVRLLEPTESVAQMDAMGVAFCCRILNQVTTDDFSPDRLVIRVSEPAALPPAVVRTAAVIRCDRGGFSVRFPSDWLTKPLPDALKRSVEGLGSAQIDRPSARPPDAIRQVVEAYLDHGAVLEIKHLARLFDTSEKAIQRQLRKSGTSFQTLLDDARHTRALGLIGDPAQTVTNVAYSLGYTDPASFSRAFRRWTGRSPRQWRHHALS